MTTLAAIADQPAPEGLDLDVLLDRARSESAALLRGQAEDAERAAYLGALLHEIQHRGGHAAAGQKSFAALTTSLGFTEGEPELYIESRGVPTEHLAEARGAAKLRQLASQAEGSAGLLPGALSAWALL